MEQTSKSSKRTSEELELEEDVPAKKAKRPTFSAREFRKCLQNADQIIVSGAIKGFHDLISQTQDHSFILQYLENGGSCIEILQTLERESGVSPSQVFDIMIKILLNINQNFPQYKNIAFDSCRYLLNSYVPVINKMLGLSSSGRERKAVLRLLTTIITFSASLAKDILIHVNFNLTNIELLTKNTGDKDSVRDCFIHFLTAFLVNGHYATLSVLLEKKGLLTSIVPGLKYDVSDTVCIVLTAMKSNVLENPSVSKTSKMRVFNTQVVKDIVSLYNWKGPAGLQVDKKNSVKVGVDEFEKSKVNQVVHEFLLTLCTSHKYGVIFRDHNLGLGKDQNKLVYTVLDSLERPWEHSYAKELVIKICSACPDLTKTMWNNLKEFIIPRPSTKWLNAVNFAKALVNELEPLCIEFCLKDLSIHQIPQAIMNLVAPSSILKTLLAENTDEKQRQAVRYNIFLLLCEMLKSLSNYLELLKLKMSTDGFKIIQKSFQDYVAKHFPNISSVLEKWDVIDENIEADISCTTLDLLESVFDIFKCYKKLNPQILEDLNTHEFNFDEILQQIGNLETTDAHRSKSIQIKAVSIFFDCDPYSFTITGKLFQDAFSISLEYYHETKSEDVFKVLTKLLKNSSVFDDCEGEISYWINSILYLKTCKESVTSFIVNILRACHDNLNAYLKELSELIGKVDTVKDMSFLIDILCDSNSYSYYKASTKFDNLNPLIIACVRNITENDVDKYIKNYVQSVILYLVHSQPSSSLINKIISPCHIFSSWLTDYINSWTDQEISPMTVKKSKGKCDVLSKFSEAFLEGDIKLFLDQNTHNLDLYPDLKFHLLQMSLFYFTNLVNHGIVEETHFNNAWSFIEFLFKQASFNDNKYVKTILHNPLISQHFSLLHLYKNDAKMFNTKLVINTLRVMKDQNRSNFGLEMYENKCVKNILNVIRKPQKYKDVTFLKDDLEIFQLSYKNCLDVINNVHSLIFTKEDVFPVFLSVVVYCLERILFFYKTVPSIEPLDKEIIANLCSYADNLIEKQSLDTSSYSKALTQYLEIFPALVSIIPKKYFTSLIQISDPNPDNVGFMVFMFSRNLDLIDTLKENIDNICGKKGLFLGLLEVIVISDFDNDILDFFYTKFEPSLLKVLNKPQKASQYFKKHYKALGCLIDQCMPETVCKNFINKINKYEVCETFHFHLLQTIFKKALKLGDINDKQLHNIILVLIHLNTNAFKYKLKNENEDNTKLQEVGGILDSFLDEYFPYCEEKDFTQVCQNEAFSMFCKFCLKFGVSSLPIYVNIIEKFIKMFKKYLPEENAKLILDMMLSHSEFLDVVLNGTSVARTALLSLLNILVTFWSSFMERSHLPVLLAAYRGTLEQGDRIILHVLKMYESSSNNTNFYEFKPLLWGKAAATHYSVHQDIQKAIWRQPKVGDVMDILQEHLVCNTIKNHPLTHKLRPSDLTSKTSEEENTLKDVYNLAFFIPLFSSLLVSENVVPTYKFSKSGALSLMIIALSNDDSEMRAGACHVLHRFYNHLEARTSGKDNALWLRFVEVVCKAAAFSDDYKLHNFASVYLARMALILTQPNHVMYVPLAYYLTAKADLDFKTIPELYTFLFSSDVNHIDHRHFILEILVDGCRTDKDFNVFVRTMAHKLIMVMFSSPVCDDESKLLILNVFIVATKSKIGCKVLYENHSFLAFIENHFHVLRYDQERRKSKSINKLVLERFLKILYNFASQVESVKSRVDKLSEKISSVLNHM